MMMNPDTRKKINQVIARAWADEGFKCKLLSSPTATLMAEGVEMPAGVELRVVEDTDRLVHVVLPAKPQLSDDDLQVGNALRAC